MTEQNPQNQKKTKRPKPPFPGLTPKYTRFLIGTKQLPYGGLDFLHMVTALQMATLHGSPTSEKYFQGLLGELWTHHYVEGEDPHISVPRSKFVYVIGTEGIAFWKEQDKDVSHSLRSVKELDRSYSHIQHLKELNDVFISAMLLCKQEPLYRIVTLIHDRELKRQPCKVQWHGKTVQIIPDGFLHFHITLPDGRKVRMPIVLEHDRNNEFGEGFKKKVRNIIAWVKAEGYKARFGVNSINIAFTTFESEQRRDRMREVVREELGSDLQRLGHLFVFTAQPEPPEASMWVRQCWYTVHDKPPIALLGDIQ